MNFDKAKVTQLLVGITGIYTLYLIVGILQEWM